MATKNAKAEELGDLLELILKINDELREATDYDVKIKRFSHHEIKDYPDNMKRIPDNSLFIYVKFDSKENRNSFIKDPHFKALYGALIEISEKIEIENRLKIEVVYN